MHIAIGLLFARKLNGPIRPEANQAASIPIKDIQEPFDYAIGLTFCVSVSLNRGSDESHNLLCLLDFLCERFRQLPSWRIPPKSDG